MGGMLEAKRPAALQVRLIEARNRLSGACRDEQRVQEIRLPVQRGITGVEFDVQGIRAERKRRGGNDQVPVDEIDIDRPAVRLHGMGLRPGRQEHTWPSGISSNTRPSHWCRDINDKGLESPSVSSVDRGATDGRAVT
jgi:hypothetical protein